MIMLLLTLLDQNYVGENNVQNAYNFVRPQLASPLNPDCRSACVTPIPFKITHVLLLRGIRCCASSATSAGVAQQQPRKIGGGEGMGIRAGPAHAHACTRREKGVVLVAAVVVLLPRLDRRLRAHWGWQRCCCCCCCCCFSHSHQRRGRASRCSRRRGRRRRRIRLVHPPNQ